MFLFDSLTDSRVIVSHNALQLLLSTGFEVKEVSDERMVTFVRDDSALLYMTISLFDTILTAIEPYLLSS